MAKPEEVLTFSINNLSKREYFAMMFAQGIIIGTGVDGFVQYEEETVATNAIKMADELIKQLEK